MDIAGQHRVVQSGHIVAVDHIDILLELQQQVEHLVVLAIDCVLEGDHPAPAGLA
jgi:hypothetical protein